MRVTAYLKRFVNNCRQQTQGNRTDVSQSRAITATEFEQSRTFWLRAIQSEVFAQEIAALQQHRPLSSKSSIISLSPFVDSENLLRVGGRLRHSQLPSESKYPILLADHPLTTIIIRHTHQIALHAGTQLTLSTLRQKFWIIKV